MIEENIPIEDVVQGVMSMRYLKEAISTTKLALVDQYRDLVNLSKRCLENGTERMIVIGTGLIDTIIDTF